MLDVALFDLDGVVRHFDPASRLGIEERAGLAPGTLQRIAFAEPIITEVTTGVIDRARWVAVVGEEIGDPAAAAAWLANRGVIDPGMRRLLQRLASTPIVVALLTNGTDTVDDELQELGLTTLFDHVFNSHHLGVRKPDPLAYRRVAEALDVEAPRIWFTDDTPANVAGAAAVGFVAEPFDGAVQAEASLRALGVPIPSASMADRGDESL